jgi:hypothetical protein
MSFEDGEVTEQEILDVLEAKHTKDLFVSHCKVGPSYGNGQLIMDAWVMPYSWVKPIRAYEVKTSRSDFRRDRKWRQYLFFCHKFYFVVPWGMIDKREIPPPAGLIYVTKTGKSIRYIVHAQSMWRNEIPSTVFQYVLMWRRECWQRRNDTAKHTVRGSEDKEY